MSNLIKFDLIKNYIIIVRVTQLKRGLVLFANPLLFFHQANVNLPF